MKRQEIVSRRARADKAPARARVLLFPQHSPDPSESEIAALILGLKQDSPGAMDAMTQLYDMISGIVGRYVGPNPSAPDFEDQVDDLLTIALDVIYSGALPRPSSLPNFVGTLARQWNRAPEDGRIHRSETKPGGLFRFPARAKLNLNV
jgi:hypothetical protein